MAGILLSTKALKTTEDLIQLLNRHLAYKQPTPFHLSILIAGPAWELLVWVASQVHGCDPMSLLARGTYDSEFFAWSNSHEEYEITLDDLSLEEVGFSMESD
jgi:hypothetical protein